MGDDRGWSGPLERLGEVTWRIPRSYKAGMCVDGIIYADAAQIERLRGDQAAEQVANVACLPGIVGASLAMPDIHWGYGFPIGGVAATDPDAGGVVSPGGVGYDINCGVRLLRTNLGVADVRPHLARLMEALYRHVPAGAGGASPFHFSGRELRRLMREGVPMLAERGLATAGDIAHCEEHGALSHADAEAVGARALERGTDQCGSLGSGNHFLEVQFVERIDDAEAAAAMGLSAGMVTVLIHSGSRGLGHQVCTDTLHAWRDLPQQLGIALPDRQLVCAPVQSSEGRAYLGAMRAAANFAFANRQLLTVEARSAFAEVFGRPWETLGLTLVYDVAHNLAKLERHMVGGNERTLCVHRKGATRAFPPGHPTLPPEYRAVGQPVFIPGDMGRASWVLAGTAEAMRQTWGTTCHGAGRTLSRHAAVRAARGRNIAAELAAQGIVALAHSRAGLAEESSEAYKDVDLVVEVVARAGLSKRVARLRPLGVIKG